MKKKKNIFFIIGIVVLLLIISIIAFFIIKNVKNNKEIVEKNPLEEIIENTEITKIQTEDISEDLRMYLDSFDDLGYFYSIEESTLSKEDLIDQYQDQFKDEEGVVDEEALNTWAEQQLLDFITLKLIIKDNHYLSFDQITLGDSNYLLEDENEESEEINQNEETEEINEDEKTEVKHYNDGIINLLFNVDTEEEELILNNNDFKYSVFEIKGKSLIQHILNTENVRNVIVDNEVRILEKLKPSLDKNDKIFEGEFRRLVINPNNKDKSVIIQNEEDGRKQFFIDDAFYNKLKTYAIRTNIKVTYDDTNTITELRFVNAPSKINGEIVEVIGIDEKQPRLRIKEGSKEYILIYEDLVEEVKDFELELHDLIEVKYKNHKNKDDVRIDDDEIEVIVGDTTERKALLDIDKFRLEDDKGQVLDYKLMQEKDLSDNDKAVLKELTNNKGYYVSDANNKMVIISTKKGHGVKIEELRVEEGVLKIQISEPKTDDDKNYQIINISGLTIDIQDKDNIKVLDQDFNTMRQMIVKTLD